MGGALDEIDWHKLTPRGCAILSWIALPISLGVSQKELAQRFNLQRPEIQELPLPAVVSSGIGQQMRHLRRELRSETGRWENE